LQQHHDFLGIYNIGAGTSGIGEAIEEAGRGGEITFVGHELMRVTRRFLISGVLDAVINQNGRQRRADAGQSPCGTRPDDQY
jgi:LacI family transcriptional regulator